MNGAGKSENQKTARLDCTFSKDQPNHYQERTNYIQERAPIAPKNRPWSSRHRNFDQTAKDGRRADNKSGVDLLWILSPVRTYFLEHFPKNLGAARKQSQKHFRLELRIYLIILFIIGEEGCI